MSEFKREHRYTVFKTKDVMACLSDEQKAQLKAIAETIEDYRYENAKQPFMCVCVDDDWPEYEIVWRMIEARCTGNPIELGIPLATPDNLKNGWTLNYQFVEKIEEASKALGAEVSMEDVEIVLRCVLPFVSPGISKQI